MPTVKVWHKLLFMAVALVAAAAVTLVVGVQRDGDRVLTAVGATLLLLAALVALVARRITVPIGRLSDTYAAVRAGDLSVRVPVESHDELGRLAEAFNETVAILEQRSRDEHRELARAARLEAAADQCEAFAMQVANGDLSGRLAVDADTELSDLAGALNTMVESLGRLSGEVRGASSELASATSQILTVVRRHSSATTEQAASISQTTVTVDEVRASAEQSATRAREVAASATRAVEVADDGTSAVDDIVSGMALIRSRVEAIAAQIASLSDRTAQIDAITNSVSDIADQSNMLALNATIEAAKAGEQGRGFAVVANEVRNLAEQSKAATAQVREILAEIERATASAVEATQEGTRATDLGVQRARRAGEAIGELSGVVRETAAAAEAIAAAAREQSVGMDEITRAMSGVSVATGDIAGGADQTEQAAAGLSALSDHLEQLTGRFRVADARASADRAPSGADRWRDPRLVDLEHAVERASSLQQASALVARAAAEALDADCGVVAKFDGDTGIALGAVLPPGHRLDRFPLVGRSGLATVARSGAPARVADYRRLGDEEMARVARAGAYTNSVAAPIRIDGRVWGGILVATRRPEPISVRAEMFLANAATILARAIATRGGPGPAIPARVRQPVAAAGV